MTPRKCLSSPALRGRPWQTATVLVGAVIVGTPSLLADAPNPDPARLEAEIAAFEQHDREQPPAAGSVLFLGSSSIRLWPLRKSFPDLPVVNRGFGGSHFSDAVHFADRILAGHQPQIIVLYEGDNDIAAGKSPQQVANDFRKLIARIRKLLPSTHLVVVSIKPSPARWQYFQAMQQANRLMRAEVERSEKLDWVDIVQPMLDSDGRPCRALFRDDCLHLNESGYRLWTKVIGCTIRRDLKAATKH